MGSEMCIRDRQSSCPDRLAEATKLNFASCVVHQIFTQIIVTLLKTETCGVMLSALYVDFVSLRISVGIAGAPPWGVSAPDLAVGTWACAQTRGIRRSPAAPAHARPGPSENRMFGASDSSFVAIRKSKVHLLLA